MSLLFLLGSLCEDISVNTEESIHIAPDAFVLLVGHVGSNLGLTPAEAFTQIGFEGVANILELFGGLKR